MLRTGIAVAAVAGLLAAGSSAETWSGTVKATAGCLDQGVGKDKESIIVTLDPGSFGEGTVLFAGTTVDGFSDRIPARSGEAFAFSSAIGDGFEGAVMTLTGTIKRGKLKGTLHVHAWDATTVCIGFGKVKAK